MRKRTRQVSRSRSNLGEADDQESNNVDSVDLHRNISRDASISRHNLESNIEDYKNDIPSYEEYMNEKPGEMVKNLDSYCHSTNPTYVKENGKQVFKITRYNKSTQKEKIISKNRRIISKWPHSFLKYYAKGMCKKCYHSFGREKKAYEWGHDDKPLYAKGYCKQCYLSKYKEKLHTASGIAPLSNRSKKYSQTSTMQNNAEVLSLNRTDSMFNGQAEY